MIRITYELSASHLSRATAIFVVDVCQFGPSWIFCLKMELVACANLVGVTISIFSQQIQLGPNWQQSRTKMAVAGMMCNADSSEVFHIIEIKCKVSTNTAFLRCNTNQFGIGHKLHFKTKHRARAKLAAIKNKNGCGTAEV